jgi:hypothetical protein
MKKSLLTLAGVMCALAIQAQSWVQANSMGGRNNIDGTAAIARDGSGNMYVTGDFEGAVPFGGGGIAAQGFVDQFLSKYDAAGSHLWTIQIGSVNNVMSAGGVTTDAAGNVYLAGNFQFFLVINGVTYTAQGTEDAFLAKYSPNGVFQWVKIFTGNGRQKIVALTSFGTSLYLSGVYNQEMIYGTLSLPTATGAEDAFLIKTDSAGNTMWHSRFGGTSDDRGTSISVSQNTVYWAGFYRGTVNFNGTNLSSGTTAHDDMVILKFDQLGNQLWAKDYGGNYREAIFGVSQDAAGNPHCTGIFYGTVNFGIQTIVEADYSSQNPAGNGDAFVMKLNASDGSCIWVRHIRGSVDNNEVGQAISTDPGYSSYVTGTINGSGSQFAIFGSNANQTGTNINPTNGNDCFVAKYDINGTLLWVIKTGGSNSERGQSILWDATGYLNVAGNFSGQITLGANTLSAPSQAAVFVARYNGLTTGIGTIEADPSLVLFPNPASDFIRLSSEERLIDGIEIYNLNGSLVMQERFPFGNHSLELNIANLTQGQYLIHVISGEKRSIQQFQVH